MVIDISVAVIAFAFVVLVIFLIATLRKVMQTLHTSKRAIKNLDHISEEGKKLIRTSNDLAIDIKEKSEALNFFFHPLEKLNKRRSDPRHLQVEKIAEIINFAMNSMVLLNKLKKKR